MRRVSEATCNDRPRMPFKRIVILCDDNSPWLSAAAAVTCATLPCFLAPSGGWGNSYGDIVLANRLDGPQALITAEEGIASDGVPNPFIVPLSTLCRDLSDGRDIMKHVAFTADGNGHAGTQSFVPSVEDDLFIYVLATCGGDVVDHSALRSLADMHGVSGFSIGSSGVLVGPRCAPRLIIIADGPSRRSVYEAAKPLSNWFVLICIVPCFAPPSFNLQLTASLVRECDVMCGVLECVALGVAMGTVKRLPLNFGDPVRTVPLDVAISTAAVILLQDLGKGPTAARAGVTTVPLTYAADSTLVWGMFGQYLMDYYGRAALQVVKASPLQWMFDSSPALQLKLKFSNWVSYGTSTMMPLACYYDRAAAQRRKQLTEHHPHSNVARKVSATLANISTCIHNVVYAAKPSGSSIPHDGEWGVAEAERFSTKLLKAVEGDATLRPLYQYVSLSSVRWDIFVKVIAQAVLERVACKLAGQLMRLPPPLPLYHNDITFHSPLRAPQNGLLTRFFPEDMRWLQRSGLRPNGSLVPAEPGLTEESLACILERPAVLQIVKKTAEVENITEKDVMKRATAILRGMGDNLNQCSVRVFGVMVRRVLFRLFNEVTLNAEAFERLHAATTRPRTHVMLLPAHRSYIDFIIMTYLLLVMGLTLPHVCAGDDFLRMGQLSKLMRGSGAFFIRRTFRNDMLYSALFKEYIRNLVIRRQVVEFFIEGTRSRTGKTQRPMLGVLKFIADTLLSAQEIIDDVCILPVSLSYDELLETKLYASEQLGLSKPRESLANLMRASSVLGRRHGKIHVYVAEPISLRSFCRNPHQCPDGFEPLAECNATTIRSGSGSSESEADCAGGLLRIPQRVLTNVAWHVTHVIQDNTVITPTALLAAVLGAPSPPKGGVSLREAQNRMLWLRDHILRRRARMSEDCLKGDMNSMCHIALFHLADFVETRVEAGETWLAVRQDGRAPLGLTICSNQLIHVFVDEAIVAVAARSIGRLSCSMETICIPTGELKGECESLRRLLAGEFQDYLPWCPYTYASWFKNAVARLLSYNDNPHDDYRSNNIETTAQNKCDSTADEGKVPAGTQGRIVNNSPPPEGECTVIRLTQCFRFLTGVLYPFVESLYVVSVAVAAVAEAGMDNVLCRNPLLLACQKWALELFGEKRLVVYLQSCSSVALKSAFMAVMELVAVESRPKERDVVYVLPTAPGGLEVRLEPIMQQLRRLLQPLREETEGEERAARDRMVGVYKQVLMTSKRESKV